MPLSEQEERCIDYACHYLEEHYGGNWSVQKNLDDLKLQEPTPEVIVGNGTKTAAVEVKRLIDFPYRDYIAYLRSNEKRLKPPCGGSYYLCPALGFKLPMTDNLQQLVKHEIERVAPTLSVGQKGTIRIPRQGHVSLIEESGPSFLSCSHGDPYPELISNIKERMTGKFMLIDEGLEHSFITQECKEAFEEAVVAACKGRLQGKTSSFDWYEEWELTRIDKEDGEDGVWIIASTGAHSVQASVEQCVHYSLENAIRKFRRTPRWADLHLVVLEASLSSPARLAAGAVERFMPEDRALIDHFLIVEGEDIVESSDLMSSMARAAEAKEQQQYLHIIESPISEARVQRFKDDYLKGRWDIGATEKIFKYYGAFQYRTECNELAKSGFNRLVNKGPFVDGSNWADLRGWEFAVAEERYLLRNLHTRLAESVNHTSQILSDTITREPDAILDAAKSMADLLGIGEATLILLATHMDTEVIVSLEKALTTPCWDLGDELRTNWVLGKHEESVVLYLNESELNSLYVIDVPRFASVIQYDPLVDLHVLAIDEAAAKRLLEENPKLKSDVDTLLSMVQLILYQSYELQIRDQSAVWSAKLAN